MANIYKTDSTIFEGKVRIEPDPPKNVDDKFMTIVPRSKTYLNENTKPIPLRVMRDGGVEFNPDLNITVNDLNNGKKRFINANGKGDKFKINIIIYEKDTFPVTREFSDESWQTIPDLLDYEDKVRYSGDLVEGPYRAILTKQVKFLEALDYWIRNMTVFIVTTRAVDIPNGEYVITENGSRKQTHDGATIWELEFTRYTGANTLTIKYSTNYADKAAAKYKKQKAAKAKKSKSTKKKTQTSVQKKLAKCKICKIQYTKNKNNTCICTYYMQYELKRQKFYPANAAIDGWYGSKTLEAVKKFQNKYKKKFKLTPNGKADSKTIKAICKV